jgi:hypothetical protein
MRNLLQEVRDFHCFRYLFISVSQVYFGKTRDVVYDLRSVDDLEKARRQRELQKELVGSFKK